VTAAPWRRLGPGNWTLRVRLTVLYGGMFVVAGALLLAVTYVLVERSLDGRLPNERIAVTNGAGSADRTGPTAGLGVGPDGVVRQPLDQETVRRIQDEIAAEQQRFRTDTLNALLGYGALALGVVGVAAVGFGWLMAERVLRPLHRITDTATRISKGGGLHERIALTGPRDEITELAGTFDAMLQRLDESFDGQRRFVANASHELRTPLAINRALLEVAVTRDGASADLRQLGGTLLAVNARHERLIEGLLTLARSEHEVPERVPVDLAHVVEYVAEELVRSDSVTVHIDTASAPVVGDPVLLQQLVVNLLGNGVRHNIAAGGWVRARTARVDGVVELVVSNTGPVVPAYEAEAVFEPFRRLGTGGHGSEHGGHRGEHRGHGGGDRLAVRADGSPAGVGLGLSIVRAVARAHGGEARAVPRDGGGLVVRVVLPA
jgi:signal transduction histidine kinase